MQYTIPLLLLLAFFSHPAIAGGCQPEKLAALPVTYVGLMPTIPITINGKAYNILLDTGAETSVVTPKVANEMHLPLNHRSYNSRLIGTSGTYGAVNAIIASLVVAGVEYKNQSVTVIPLDPERAPDESKSGLYYRHPSIGLLGIDILSDFDMEYDVPARTVTLYRAIKCASFRPPWKGKYERIPNPHQDMLRLTLPVLVDGHKFSALLDTGATMTGLAALSATNAGIGMENLMNDKTRSASGIGGFWNKARLHRFTSMEVAHEYVPYPVIGISRFPANDYDMLLGEDYMKGHRFWFSYPTQTLFVQNITH